MLSAIPPVKFVFSLMLLLLSLFSTLGSAGAVALVNGDGGDNSSLVSATTTTTTTTIFRSLQAQTSEQHRGKTVLTVLYLCVLGLCFIVPVFYYFRMHCEERQARRLRELEIAGISQALEQSEQNREESRAARRKYREERRARIVQLFTPVRMILKEENFPHLKNRAASAGTTPTGPESESTKIKIVTPETPTPSDDLEAGFSSENSESEAVIDTNQDNGVHTKTEAEAENATETQQQPDQTSATTAEESKDVVPAKQISPYGDEEEFYIKIPAPGLHDIAAVLTGNVVANNNNPSVSSPMRLATGTCSICLCNYEVGSDVVWSSNHLCDHVFHAECIEQWLMKQREGPLCPCCRRDFIIDPFDLEDETELNAISGMGDIHDTPRTNFVLDDAVITQLEAQL